MLKMEVLKQVLKSEFSNVDFANSLVLNLVPGPMLYGTLHRLGHFLVLLALSSPRTSPFPLWRVPFCADRSE